MIFKEFLFQCLAGAVIFLCGLHLWQWWVGKLCSERLNDALKRKEKELNDIQRLAHIGSWYLDANSQKIIATPELFLLQRLDPASAATAVLKNLPFYNLAEQSQSKVHDAVEKVLQTGMGYELDLQGRTQEGEPFWLAARGEAVYDERGLIIGLRGTLQDITQRKKDEEALRFLINLNSALQPLTDPEAIMSMTARMLGAHLGVDRCAYALVEDEDTFVITGEYLNNVPSIVGRWPVAGFGQECVRLMLANQPYVVVDTDADPRIKPEDISSYRAATVRSVICVPLHKDGKLTAAMAVHQKYPRRWTAEEIGLVGLVVGRCWESLERARTIHSLEQSEQRLRFMAESMPQKVFTAKPNGNIDYLNEQWMEFIGQHWEDVRNWGWVDFVHPDDREENVRLWKNSLQTGESFQVEHRFRRSDGVYRWHLTRAHAMRNRAGHIVMWLGSNTDIDDQKRAEEAIKEYASQLEKSNRNLEESTSILEVRVSQRTKQLEEQAERLRKLALELTEAEQKERRRLAEVLHDHLQQYLVAAKMRLDMIERKSVNIDKKGLVEARSYIDRAVDSSRRLTAELRPPVLYEGGLNAGLRYLAQKMEEQHKVQIHLSVTGDIEPGSDLIKVMIYQCVQELLFNAVKYAHVSECFVAVARLNDRIQVTVEDRGTGFDSSQLPDRDRGGFGLFSIRERVKALGGDFRISSVPGQGSMFLLLVPDKMDLRVDKRTDLLHPMVARERSEEEGIVVLVADDHPIIRQSMASLLISQPFIKEVIEAANGEEAILKAEISDPDVVLMDVNMPVINGIEATQMLCHRNPRSKVIGLSVQPESEMSRTMKDAGAVAYFNKGDDTTRLIDAIRKFSYQPSSSV